MSTKYLLDTSVLVLSLKQDTTIRKRLSATEVSYIPSIALGELYYGAEHSVHVEKGLAEVNELAEAMIIVSTDSTTAKVYGYVKHELRVKGLLIPDNDLWIAAIAIQHGLMLAARDQHFTRVAELSFEQW